MGGARIPAGSFVAVSLGAANRGTRQLMFRLPRGAERVGYEPRVRPPLGLAAQSAGQVG